MNNYVLLPLLLCFWAVHSKVVLPEPPRIKIGPFDSGADNTTSPIGEDQKMFEGDIINSGRKSDYRSGEAGTTTPWPGAVIPYRFHCSVENIDSALNSTLEAMKEWESKTCVKFVKKMPQDTIYLEFIRERGCSATYVGYKGKKTQISIGHRCDYKHVMVHELGHVIGFWHEQSRKDRDDWISINRGSVMPSKLHNFDKVDEQTNNYGEPYDYGSIMHYPWNAFAVDRRRNTIVPLKSPNGKRPYVKLSDSDAAQANRMYRCNSVIPTRASASKAIGEAKSKMSAGVILAGPNCQDGHDNCPIWAKHGHCTIAPDPMLTFCAKSCDNCGPCVDNSEYCNAWADYGLCTNSGLEITDYMLRHCKVSCSICTPAPTIKPTTMPTTKIPTTTPKPTTTPTMAQIYTTAPKSGPATVQTKGRVSTPLDKFTGVCTDDLGVHSPAIIKSGQLYGSSMFRPGLGWSAPASSARLYKEDDKRNKHVGAWCAARSRDSYLQIDFRQRKNMTALATQGRDVYFEHVKTYSLSFSDDGHKWRKYKEGGVKKIFDGNCDYRTPVLNLLYPVTARFLRIHPIKYIGKACLRVEVYGCNA